MTKRITTENASIRTTSVDVRVITISGKQMTLSVFRQLKEEDLIDPVTLTLRGTTWGTVNYFWGDDIKYAHKNLHVVWQHGDELRRSLAPRDLYQYRFWVNLRDELTTVFEAMTLLAAIDGQIDGELEEEYVAEIEGRRLVTRTGNDGIGYVARRQLTTVLDYRRGTLRKRYSSQEFADREYEQAVEGLRDHLRDRNLMDFFGTFDEVKSHVTEMAKVLNDAETQWAKLRTSLEQLDQLFIAV
jgi:hypothetical protein